MQVKLLEDRGGGRREAGVDVLREGGREGGKDG
jgi:hypothetical protein